jgi:hypothetical protein
VERRVRNPEVLASAPGRSTRPMSSKPFMPSRSINWCQFRLGVEDRRLQFGDQLSDLWRVIDECSFNFSIIFLFFLALGTSLPKALNVSECVKKLL